MKQNDSGKIRIIGGKWRGRKLPVAAIPGLRPTPDRVRETLFNWLQPIITGAECLDLFAGTGVLGFEAMSRGAGRVVMIEQNRTLGAVLQKQVQILGADGVEIIIRDTLQWLQSAAGSFDIVFMDPPFGKNLVPKTCRVLVNRGHLREGTLVYVENEPGIKIDKNIFHIEKQAQAGQVNYSLLAYYLGKQ